MQQGIDKEQQFEAFVNGYQQTFLEMISKYEPKVQPIKDAWDRADKQGYGLSCIIQDGEFFEKAGVNTTRLTIPLSAGLAQQMKERAEKTALIESLDLNNLSKYVLYANGVSLVIHPINPFVPTVHANFRFLRVKEKETGSLINEWFGGGCDLTPNYLFDEDAIEFHQAIRDGMVLADATKGPQLYERYKDECDKYFYNKHRKEVSNRFLIGQSRGVGGVFYDDFYLNNSFEDGLQFQQQVAQANLASYENILKRRKDTPYEDRHVRWRQYRRGRYVEFNLVYDRGTKFGLMTPDARIESILMSLPLIARWEYDFKIEENSEEARLVDALRNPRKWV